MRFASHVTPLFLLMPVKELQSNIALKVRLVLIFKFITIHSGADEDFPLQYRMFGQDFITDLIGLMDITVPITQLMILSQAVDFYHWKVAFWGKRMLHWMEDISQNLQEMPPS